MVSYPPPTIRMEAVHVREKGAFNNVSLCVTCPAESVLLHILLFSVLRHYGGRPLMSGRSPPGRTPSRSDATDISIPSLYTATAVAAYHPPTDEVCEAGFVVTCFDGTTYAIWFIVQRELVHRCISRFGKEWMGTHYPPLELGHAAAWSSDTPSRKHRTGTPQCTPSSSLVVSSGSASSTSITKKAPPALILV